MDGIVDSKGRYGSGEGRPVKDTKVFLGFQRNGFDIVIRKSFPRRHDLARTKDGRSIKNTNRRVSNQGASNV